MNIRELQLELKRRGFDPGSVDGIRGPKTDAAIIAFKQSVGLEARSYVGPKTLAAMGLPSESAQRTSFVNLQAPALSPSDKIRAAENLGVSINHINMLLKVESGGKSFDDKGRPIILFEPHIFHRRTGGVWSPSFYSYSKWGGKPYPKSFDGRWQQLEAAATRNRVAALESASWGLFQVMGFHWQALGYASVNAFASAMTDGEPEQLDAMVRYITVNKLREALQVCKAGDPDSCRAFAKGYNGGGYAKNDYHTKMARALA